MLLSYCVLETLSTSDLNHIHLVAKLIHLLARQSGSVSTVVIGGGQIFCLFSQIKYFLLGVFGRSSKTYCKYPRS